MYDTNSLAYFLFNPRVVFDSRVTISHILACFISGHMKMHHAPIGSLVHMRVGIKAATPYDFPEMHHKILRISLSLKAIQICTHILLNQVYYNLVLNRHKEL